MAAAIGQGGRGGRQGEIGEGRKILVRIDMLIWAMVT